jgi:GNAT superfamily N-acetyltransferase
LKSAIHFVVAFQDGRCIGTLGCEVDEESGRGWLRGPFVLANADNWDKIAVALLQELLADFIGVRADARGQGIGQQLLQTALQWFFETKQTPQAGLVVNDDLTNARSLCEKVGFELNYTGIHTRKEEEKTI